MKRILKSLEELRDFAKEIADKILAGGKFKGAVVLALAGDLGAGKTTFAQAFAKELGVKERVLSPTFLIFRSYKLKAKNYQLFYHCDVYRLKDEKELEVLKFSDILNNPQNIVLIEWADKIKEILPKDAVWLHFSHGKSEGERVVDYSL